MKVCSLVFVRHCTFVKPCAGEPCGFSHYVNVVNSFLWVIFPCSSHLFLPLFLSCSIMVNPPTINCCRDAHQFRPVPLPLSLTQPSLCMWFRKRDACPVLPVPPRTWGLEDADPCCPSWPFTRSPLLLSAGPSCCPRVPGSASPSSQLRRAVWSGRGLVGSGFRVSQPPLHAAAAWGARRAERHHHGSPSSQNPEHAAGPPEGVGVSIKEICRQRIPFKLDA